MVASDDTVSLWSAVLRRWPLALVLVTAAAAAGVAASRLVHTTYTSEVRLAVGNAAKTETLVRLRIAWQLARRRRLPDGSDEPRAV